MCDILSLAADARTLLTSACAALLARPSVTVLPPTAGATAAPLSLQPWSQLVRAGPSAVWNTAAHCASPTGWAAAAPDRRAFLAPLPPLPTRCALSSSCSGSAAGGWASATGEAGSGGVAAVTGRWLPRLSAGLVLSLRGGASAAV